MREAKDHACWNCCNEEPERSKCTSCDGSGFDTCNEDTPICPYCGHEMSTDDLYESGTRTCYGCDRDVKIEIEYAPSYTTFKGDKVDVERKANKDGIASAKRQLERGDTATAAYVVMQLPITRELGLIAEVAAIRNAGGSPDMAQIVARIEEVWKAKEGERS